VDFGHLGSQAKGPLYKHGPMWSRRFRLLTADWK